MSLKHSLVLTTAIVAAVASAQDAAKPQAELPPKPPEGWKYVTAKDGSYQFLFPNEASRSGSRDQTSRRASFDVFIPRRCPNGCSLFVVFTQGGGQASARACETVWSTVMAKFLFIYRESTVSRAKPSPEEMQALAAAWGTWMQKFRSAIVPGGDGLKHTGRVVKAGLVTDGP